MSKEKREKSRKKIFCLFSEVVYLQYTQRTRWIPTWFSLWTTEACMYVSTKCMKGITNQKEIIFCCLWDDVIFTLYNCVQIKFFVYSTLLIHKIALSVRSVFTFSQLTLTKGSKGRRQWRRRRMVKRRRRRRRKKNRNGKRSNWIPFWHWHMSSNTCALTDIEFLVYSCTPCARVHIQRYVYMYICTNVHMVWITTVMTITFWCRKTVNTRNQLIHY